MVLNSFAVKAGFGPVSVKLTSNINLYTINNLQYCRACHKNKISIFI